MSEAQILASSIDSAISFLFLTLTLFLEELRLKTSHVLGRKLPVQQQKESDGGPDETGRDGAADAHLQCGGDAYQLLVKSRGPGGRSAVLVVGVLAVPLPGQLVVVELKPCLVVPGPEEGPAHVGHGGHRTAQCEGPVHLPPGLVLQLSEGIKCSDKA